MAYPTNPIYKFTKDLNGNNSSVLLEKNSITHHIPLDPENTDYQEYLKWVAEGNTAEAAD